MLRTVILIIIIAFIILAMKPPLGRTSGRRSWNVHCVPIATLVSSFTKCEVRGRLQLTNSWP